MPQELAGELHERVGSSSSSSSSSATAARASAAVVDSTEDSPARLNSSRRAAREYADWAWRLQRGKGVLRWKSFRQWRYCLMKSAGGDMFRRFKLTRPSTWLPEGEPTVELRKFSARDGQIQLALRHTDLDRIERHMVDSGLASPAQVAQAWRAFAVSGGSLVPVWKGDLVSVDDDSLAQHLDDMIQHNAPIVAAYKMSRAVAEASSTPSSPDLPEFSALDPPVSAPPSPPAPVVHDPPVAPVSHLSGAPLSDSVDPVELADPLEDLDEALREADEVVAPDADIKLLKKDRVVHWGQIVEGCKSCTNKHLSREKLKPGSTPKGVLAMLPLTPAKLFASTLALDFEDSTFAHVAPDGTRSVLVRHSVFREAMFDLWRRCGLTKDNGDGKMRFPVLLLDNRNKYPGATPLAAKSVTDLDRAWAAAGRPQPGHDAHDRPLVNGKPGLAPLYVVDWAELVEAFRAYAEEQTRASPSSKPDRVAAALVAMVPLTPAKLFSSASSHHLQSSTYQYVAGDGTLRLLVGHKLVARALRNLASQHGASVGQLDRDWFPMPSKTSLLDLPDAEPLGASSIADVERACEKAGRPGRQDAPVPEPPHNDKKRPAVAVAASPSVTPVSSVPSTPALSSVESTPEPPSKRARTSAAAPASVVPVVVEDKRAQRDALDEAKELGAKHFELETLRLAHAHALEHGAAAFLSLDIEMWERNTSDLLEFGWSTLELFKNRKTGKVETRRDTQHAVVKENAHRRNGKYSPDARDNFAFGRTVRLPQQAIYHTLAALLHTLSAHAHVFLIFHDPRADLRALDRIGFDTARDFEPDLRRLGALARDIAHREGGRVWVVDTQRLFSAWINRKVQTGLEKACLEVQVPTKPKLLHNAANDAYYTLNLFERLMDRQRTPSPTSTLLKHLDERARVDAERKLKVVADKAKRAEERREQSALAR
ncbi:hypothetical protein JCM8208_007668 [Rhodotorula glutinis]